MKKKVRACTTGLLGSSLRCYFCRKHPIVAWRRRPRRLTRRREWPMLRGGGGGSSSVVRLVSPTQRRPDPMRAWLWFGDHRTLLLCCLDILFAPPIEHRHPQLHRGSWWLRQHDWYGRGRRQQQQLTLSCDWRPLTQGARSRHIQGGG